MAHHFHKKDYYPTKLMMETLQICPILYLPRQKNFTGYDRGPLVIQNVRQWNMIFLEFTCSSILPKDFESWCNPEINKKVVHMNLWTRESKPGTFVKGRHFFFFWVNRGGTFSAIEYCHIAHTFISFHLYMHMCIYVSFLFCSEKTEFHRNKGERQPQPSNSCPRSRKKNVYFF